MAPSNMDYHQAATENYTHKKFKTASAYTHKKFGKKVLAKEATVTATPLFRPYALTDNTPRKRRQETEREIPQPSQQQQIYHHHTLPPTPPTTPPQMQQVPVQTLQYPAPTTPSPVLNHQAYAYMLQKQRAVLQMRQLLSINPDANTWPLEWRQALQALLQQ
ncbi:hypothetical protein KR018_000021 [Drosophila ironensis]|nr:hypothetical protein KR018_000021 [Drosophila ironensis]